MSATTDDALVAPVPFYVRRCWSIHAWPTDRGTVVMLL